MSHNQSPTSSIGLDDNAASLNSRKRKAGTSGRGVASLTPEQLAKKRANDREAQRAIRERTKATIETLEQKIQQLESQQPYQELQAIIRQKDAIQAENDEIRRRLASIMSIIQPVVGAQGLTHLAEAAQHNVHLGFTHQNANVFQQPDQYLGNGSRAFQTQSPGLQTADAFVTTFSNSDPDSSTENRVWSSSRDALSQQRDNLQRNLELNDTGERLSFSFLLDNIGSNIPAKNARPPPLSSPSTRQQPQGHYPMSLGIHSVEQPVYTMLPKNSQPTCPLDTILLHFLRQRQSEGSERSPIITPAYPSVSSLLNPKSTPPTPIDPISQLMTDIISKFPNISALPEQVATLFIMFIFMRWMVSPTQANYDKLPEWMTPRPSQLFTQHPAWVDHIPWPRMRDRVIERFGKDNRAYPFSEWFLPFTQGMSVNWPYAATDCLLSTSTLPSTAGAGLGKPGMSSNEIGTEAVNENGNDMDSIDQEGVEAATATLNPVFEQHIRRLENWSLGAKFTEAFPELSDTATFREQPSRVELGGLGHQQHQQHQQQQRHGRSE